MFLNKKKEGKLSPQIFKKHNNNVFDTNMLEQEATKRSNDTKLSPPLKAKAPPYPY